MHAFALPPLLLLLVLQLSLAAASREEYGPGFNFRENGGEMSSERQRPARAATAERERLWPNATIPYDYDSKLSAAVQPIIEEAMRHWEANTCIRFVRLQSAAAQIKERQRQMESGYVIFTVEDCGCCSMVGRSGGRQSVSLALHCTTVGVAAHELGHVVGFWHEHTRPDRDGYIEVRTENVREEKLANFDIRSPYTIDSLGRPYDYFSLMHYSGKTFSKNGFETIVAKSRGIVLGTRRHLSTEDIIQTLILYGCPFPACGGKFGDQSEGKITSPFYPHPYPPDHGCQWVITVKQGQVAHLEFEDFSLEKSHDCLADYLEVRENEAGARGKLIGRFCGFGRPPTIKTITDLHLRFHANSLNSGRGFLISYRIEDANEINWPIHGARASAPTGGDDVDYGVQDADAPVALLDMKECVKVMRARKGRYNTLLAPARPRQEFTCSLIIDGGPEALHIWLRLNFEKSSAMSEGANSNNCAGTIYKRISNHVGLFETEDGKDGASSMNPKSFQKMDYDCTSNHVELLLKVSTLIIVWSSSRHLPLDLEYVLDYDECLEKTSNACEQLCVNTIHGYKCECSSGYKLVNDTVCIPKLADYRDSCGKVLTTVSGKIRSSTEPMRDCVWRIHLPGYRIYLTFHKIDIRPADGNCSVTYVEVSSEQAGDIKGRFCGISPPDEISATGTMVIRLRRYISTFSTPMAQSTVALQEHQPYFSASYVAYKRHLDRCHATLIASPGSSGASVESPGFSSGSSYPHETSCFWRIVAPHGHCVRASFAALDIEKTRGCQFDSVEIFDGRNRQSPLVGRFCGTDVPSSVMSSGRYMAIYFSSDESGAGRGFFIELKWIRL